MPTDVLPLHRKRTCDFQPKPREMPFACDKWSGVKSKLRRLSWSRRPFNLSVICCMTPGSGASPAQPTIGPLNVRVAHSICPIFVQSLAPRPLLQVDTTSAAGLAIGTFALLSFGSRRVGSKWLGQPGYLLPILCDYHCQHRPVDELQDRRPGGDDFAQRCPGRRKRV